jgi:hypothetical protein
LENVKKWGIGDWDYDHPRIADDKLESNFFVCGEDFIILLLKASLAS